MNEEEIINEYEKKKLMLNRVKQQLVESLEMQKEKYKQIENDMTIDKKERRLEIALGFIKRKENQIKIATEKIELLRPRYEEDMAYRRRQYYQFASIIKEIVPDDLNLCFHGCPIFAAESIIKEGAISSSVDRLGVATSYDVEDQVSVTTKETLSTTIQGYAKLHDDLELPAGCIFVVTPKDENEVKSSKASMLIGNVNFKENPERLYSIITTPENIERVTKWAKESEIDTSKIHDYDGFVKEIVMEKEQEALLEELKVIPENLARGKEQLENNIVSTQRVFAKLGDSLKEEKENKENKENNFRDSLKVNIEQDNKTKVIIKEDDNAQIKRIIKEER